MAFWTFYGAQLAEIVGKFDYFIIAKLLPIRQLGLYEKAFELTSRMMSSISGPVVGIYFSSFCRLQQDPKKQLNIFFDGVQLLSIFFFPAIFGIIIIAPYFVNILLGEAWKNSIFPIQLLAISRFFRIFGGMTASINTANGKFRLQAILDTIGALFFILVCFILIKYGIIGICFAVISHQAIVFFLSILSIKILLRLSITKLFNKIKIVFFIIYHDVFFY